MRTIHDLRRLPQEVLSRLRRRVVQAVVRGGLQERIADRFGLRAATVSAWMARFRQGGSEALRDRVRGRPAAVTGDGPWVRQVLAEPPEDLPLWTMPAAAAALTRAGGRPGTVATCRRHLVRLGILPGELVGLTRNALAGRPRTGDAYLALATTQGLSPEGWTFSLVQATGQLAFLVQEGPFRLARWLGFLGRVERHLDGRPALILVHPPALASRPGVRRWLTLRRPTFTLIGAPGRYS